MKNYPHLYTPVNNKKAPFSNTLKTQNKKSSTLLQQTPNGKIVGQNANFHNTSTTLVKNNNAVNQSFNHNIRTVNNL
jgi:hypothetical protein